MHFDELQTTLANLKLEFFKDENGTCYAKPMIDCNFSRPFAINSGEFSQLIAKTVFQAYKKPIPDHLMKQYIEWCNATANFDGDTRKVYIRTAPIDHDDPLRGIEIDLGDDSGRCVRITADGYEVTKPSAEFLRPNGTMPLPVPKGKGDIWKITKYVHTTDRQQQLTLFAFMLASLFPAGPYPFLCLVGEMGSGKSAAMEFISRVIDPRTGVRKALPKSETDLRVAAMHAHLLTFDNLSHLKFDLSDSLCRISTGGSLVARKLYTDGDQHEMTFMRPAMMNGITDFVSKPDLADRIFPLELASIGTKDRKSMSDLQREFKLDIPEIFSGICFGLQTALRNHKETKVLKSGRMIEATKLAAAASSSFGSSPNEVVKAIWEVQKSQREFLASMDPVCRAVVQMLSQNHEWEGTPSQLFDKLDEHFPPQSSAQSDRPKSVSALSKRLQRHRDSLRALGVEFEANRTSDSRSMKFKYTPTAGSNDNEEYARVSISMTP